ncbi:MAG: bifunctional methylenetetrahydrofolate dehydrogenase/methenyltetrahydrofolate cyclohydrolase FolD [Gemmatimonadaceae bacterium]|nr:bifunctional methylenetetrahydrofolate dehydrogenase/methenyltetrahydrofolate cyclohydrolase FolD [Gemmatimonadaceae bacterium]
MPAEIMDGAAVAAKIRAEVAREVAELKTQGITPGLAVVLVGDDPASAVYVGAKGRACEEAGMHSVTIRLPANTTEEALLRQVDVLNADRAIDGILVQMPLPAQINADAVIVHIDPAKDVDGFHPVNVGKMLTGDKNGFIPCTPAGVQRLLHECGVDTAGKHTVIIGRSNIVGKPMAALLVQNGRDANCTVTVCHSKTRDIALHTRVADIIIVAVGKVDTLTGDMIKPGAVVVDVGMNRIPDSTKKSGSRLVGDVDYDGVREVASLITPVPGGVGPMTIAMLLVNTLRAARQRHTQTVTK